MKWYIKKRIQDRLEQTLVFFQSVGNLLITVLSIIDRLKLYFPIFNRPFRVLISLLITVYTGVS